MRTMITGAAGFIGAHCLRMILRETDWHVVCPVSFRHKGLPERLDWAIGSDWERVEIIHCDLAAPINPTTAARFGHIDYIINFASDTHPPRSVRQPVEFVHNNIDIVLYLLEYARTLVDLKAFVQISTDAVYGAVWEGTHYEWDAIVPDNPYAASKAAQEALAISYWRSYGMPLMIATTMNPIGETQDPEKFVPMTIGKILRGEKLVLHANDHGEFGRRTYIDADDLVRGILWLLYNYPPDQAKLDRPDRWNLVGPREFDNWEIASTIADYLDRPFQYEMIRIDQPQHPSRYALSGDKLAKAGWYPNDDIYGALRRITEWTAQHPLWT